MSAYEVTGDWESARKKNEREVLIPRRQLFEEYMEKEDIGLITRELAITALRAELEADEPLTEPIDTDEIKRLLGDE